MRFTVVWSPLTQDQLAVLWLNAAARNAVTRAQHQIDQLLRTDPHLQGVPFYGDYLLVVPPLQVVYRVNAQDMQVEVTMVW